MNSGWLVPSAASFPSVPFLSREAFMGASVSDLIQRDSQPSSSACTFIMLCINETDWSIRSQLMRSDCWDPTGHCRLCPLSPSQMNQESRLLSSSLCFLCFYSMKDAVDENRACSCWTLRTWTGSIASTLMSWLWILTSTTFTFSWFHLFLQASHHWAPLVGIPGRNMSCSGPVPVDGVSSSSSSCCF